LPILAWFDYELIRDYIEVDVGLLSLLCSEIVLVGSTYGMANGLYIVFKNATSFLSL